ncbi:MAG: DUF389 domain-containing protein [Gammaproteobacteria bacterium]|uniref:DUF389 domain-containing protein n=1 Tax=Methylotuvimicrobium sp. TaxID=2822413 RepID=UPI001DA160CF|nr:DUF389 domain-containing protein [Gammaproteobacteria bacterium]
MTPTEKTLLIHQQPENSVRLRSALEAAIHYGGELEPVMLDEFMNDPSAFLGGRKHVVSLLTNSELSRLLREAHRYQFSVGLLPAKDKSIICRLFNIAEQVEDAVPRALDPDKAYPVDLLLCNDEAVIWTVLIGEAPFITMRQHAYEKNPLREQVNEFLASIPNLTKLKPFELSVSTEKGQRIETAVTGVLIIENDIETLAANLINESISSQDGKLSAIFLAPSSVMEFLNFLIIAIYCKLRTVSHLPKAVGYIKSATLELSSPNTLSYAIDSRQRKAERISLKTIPQGIAINVGERYKAAHKVIHDDAKDTAKIKPLRHSAKHMNRLKKRMPFFSTAVESDFKDLFLMLRDNAKLSGPYISLMVLSSMLATFGLYLNSSPIVVGAMVLAPLMGPIVSLSMGILRNDSKLLRSGMTVFGIGIALGLFVSVITALLIPYEQLTAEIRSRSQPSLLDLGVAIISGSAAAYTHAKATLLRTLPGVAIAVALVPPLCSMGIGIAWWDWNIVSGTGLLFLTNFAGIALAAAVTFLFLGYSTMFRVNRGLGLSLLLLFLVSVPLYHSFANTAIHSRITNAINAKTYKVNDKTIEVDDVEVVSIGEKVRLSVKLHSSDPLLSEDVAALRDYISKQIERPVLLDASFSILQ